MRFIGKMVAGTVIVLLTITVLVVGCSAAASAATGWRVVNSDSASGQFAVTAINADITRPRGIAVRLKGNVSSGMGVVACSRGFSVTSNSRTFSHAGLYTLPIRAGSENCTVTASVGGSGRVTVQILRRG